MSCTTLMAYKETSCDKSIRRAFNASCTVRTQCNCGVVVGLWSRLCPCWPGIKSHQGLLSCVPFTLSPALPSSCLNKERGVKGTLRGVNCSKKRTQCYYLYLYSMHPAVKKGEGNSMSTSWMRSFCPLDPSYRATCSSIYTYVLLATFINSVVTQKIRESS